MYLLSLPDPLYPQSLKSCRSLMYVHSVYREVTAESRVLWLAVTPFDWKHESIEDFWGSK